MKIPIHYLYLISLTNLFFKFLSFISFFIFCFRMVNLLHSNYRFHSLIIISHFQNLSCMIGMDCIIHLFLQMLFISYFLFIIPVFFVHLFDISLCFLNSSFKSFCIFLIDNSFVSISKLDFLYAGLKNLTLSSFKIMATFF